MVGESSAMLKPGRRVEALVKFVGNSEARCVLPELDNLEAILGSTDISSRVQGPVVPSDHLKVGQVVNARCVMSVEGLLLYKLLPAQSNDLDSIVSVGNPLPLPFQSVCGPDCRYQDHKTAKFFDTLPL